MSAGLYKTSCAGLLLFASSACGSDGKVAPDASLVQPDAGTDAAVVAPTRLSLEQLQDPATCASCHPKQYADWSSSMHAYASNDPVFTAMNKRGQRETNGELGKFCVQCHAPMAVSNGLTTDGLNLASLPQKAQGVTCYFCHNATDVGSDHFNANLSIAKDDVMRGSIKNAVDPGVHGVAYNEGHDSRSMKSSLLCGTCHDVVNQKGLHVERTLFEYQSSIHSLDRSGNQGGDSCQGCHMPWRETNFIADVPPSLGTFALKKRDLHDHRMAAVDVALTDFPEGDPAARAAHRHATECALSEDGAYVFEILNDGQGGFSIALETTAGHAQPSGAAQDRRLWLEVIAYDANNNVLFQSGVIGDQDLEEYPLGDPKHDTQLCMFRDHLENEAGEEVHMFWEASKLRQLESKALPIAVDALSNHVATCTYRTPGRVQPARLTARMLMRPIGMDVLQPLIDSGDLDPKFKAEMPTFQLHSTVVEWKAEDGGALLRPTPKPMSITCP